MGTRRGDRVKWAKFISRIPRDGKNGVYDALCKVFFKVYGVHPTDVVVVIGKSKYKRNGGLV